MIRYRECEVVDMPAEVFDVDEFVELSEKADYCAVKRLKEVVKLKLRAPRMLYTLKVDPSKAEEVFKKLKCEIKEI
jgi:ferritin-like protein